MNKPISPDSIEAIAPSSDFDDFMVNRLRYARILKQIELNEINAVGAALSGGLISGEDAVAHLDECGLLDFVTGASL
jgi:hypothetical protein